jgi:hypothetical protein
LTQFQALFSPINYSVARVDKFRASTLSGGNGGLYEQHWRSGKNRG